MNKRIVLAASMIVALSPLVMGDVYFSDDFNTGGTAGALSRGWEFVEGEFVTEVGSNFVVAPEWPEGQDGPGGNGLMYPPTADGTPSDGGYLISDSDAGSESDDIGSLSEIWAYTPSFSTVGASEVWFHADTEIESNNNGEALARLQASADGGQTWIPVWVMVEPERVIDSFNNGVDTPSQIGGWPEFGSASQTKTFCGIHGRWHIQLPAEVANQADVKVRMGWYEPADAWWFVMDNIVIDNVPAPMGSETVLLEEFEEGIPAEWSNVSEIGGDPGYVWDVQAIAIPGVEPVEWEKFSNDLPVNIDIVKFAEEWDLVLDLDNPDPDINPKGMLDGRWVMMLAGRNYAMWQDSNYDDQAANLDTPSLDMSDATGVFLDFDSELLVGNSTNLYEVYVSADGGANFSRIFTYTEALMDYEEAPYFMHHYFEVPEAAGMSDVVFRFHVAGGDPDEMEGFWVIDNVRVTKNVGAPVPGWMLH